MPEIDGFDFLQKMKANPASRDIPVIMLTGLGQVYEANRAKEMGANDCITKPFSERSLIDLVQKYAQGDRKA